jgi:hypothetical protein
LLTFPLPLLARRIVIDTIDLQDSHSPSAQDHTLGHHQYHSNNPFYNHSNQSLAPHQAETLREVAHETAEDESRSPRSSWTPHGGLSMAQYSDGLSAGLANGLRDVQQRQGSDSMDDTDLGDESVDVDEDEEEEDDDDMMDRISSSPSIDDEDIDFNFVYALHTFTATVEGQANATKGDTMVLLDDSNSYWWLVRVVKDSSIGYLPAEHIETPTERLARYNKHRNIDLSAAMLGDIPGEKSKSTKKSKRKKNVAFTAPTYVDYSDIEYSDEEDEDDFFTQQQAAIERQREQEAAQQQQQQQLRQDAERQQAAMDDESAKVEPLKPRAQSKPTVAIVDQAQEDAASLVRDSDEIMDSRGDMQRQSKNGTVRNTDSFFKDDTVETKKITLTPNLLRDDNAPRTSNDSAKEVSKRPSLDKLEKDDRVKDDKKKREKDKKEKEKKPGVLRGLFSRKDKKRATEEDDDSIGKPSLEQDDGDDASSDKGVGSPHRGSSKLQKQKPRVEPSANKKNGAPGPAQISSSMEIASYLNELRTNDVSNVPPASMRIVDSETLETREVPSSQRAVAAAPAAKPRTSPQQAPQQAPQQPPQKKPQQVKPMSRLEMDILSDGEEDSDTDADEDDRSAHVEPLSARQAPSREDKVLKQEQPSRPMPGAFPDSSQTIVPAASAASAPADLSAVPAVLSPAQQPLQSPRHLEHEQEPERRPIERLSESPVEVSPITPSGDPPALLVDASSPESSRDSPSPELVDPADATPPAVSQQQQQHHHQDRQSQSYDPEQAPTVKHSHAPSLSAASAMSVAAATWNDANLRTFFDSPADIRDLLVVVYDKSDVDPAGPDHPVIGSLFREQNAKLAEITTQLDNMLGDWLSRKQRIRMGR